MYQIALVFSILCTLGECASYQRYGDTTRYPNSNYESYSTISNLYQYPYKTGTYQSDVANVPEVTRYPNYSPGYSTSSYNTFSTQRTNYAYNQPEYSTQNYGQSYGEGYSSYEMPFVKNIRDYCVNRSPQTGIWVDSLMGMWYGVEFIQHLGGESRVDFARTCIVMHISEPIEKDIKYLHTKLKRNLFSGFSAVW